MPTLADVAAEVESQPGALASLAARKLRMAPRGSLLVGAGDSYASALCAQYLSNSRVAALDPYVLIASPSLARGRAVYFITNSGRTRANVAAAKAVRGTARRTVAVTSVSASPIADATGDVIELPYAYVPRMPGTLSFTLSVTAAIALARGGFKCDFARVFARSKRSVLPRYSSRGCTYFLGNGPAYPIALYSSLKVFEIIGSRAVAELVEEFGHASLFSLRPTDVVNILAAFDPASVGSRLGSALGRWGYARRLLPDEGVNEFESVFHAIFCSQLGIVREAGSRGVERPYIVRARDKLMLSDAMIY